VFACGAQFQIHKTPVIIGSFGASAVLLYGAIDSPLGQPRNAFFGHFFGALVGVIISQLFTQVPKDWVSEGQEHAVMWVAGATAMALTLVVMQVTKTVHPPGGATALIAVVQDTAVAMKWYYIGIVVLSISLQICIATLINNIDRRYPIYWWSPKKFPMTFDPTTASTVI
ncbi:HPP family-domain-containing protein, partial [Radiomyces spectabilis]